MLFYHFFYVDSLYIRWLFVTSNGVLLLNATLILNSYWVHSYSSFCEGQLREKFHLDT